MTDPEKKLRGLMFEYSVQRYYRDNRLLLYGGGTHEVLQTTIAREILRG